jgi:hypothetical protein
MCTVSTNLQGSSRVTIPHRMASDVLNSSPPTESEAFSLYLCKACVQQEILLCEARLAGCREFYNFIKTGRIYKLISNSVRTRRGRFEVCEQRKLSFPDNSAF